MKSIGMIETVGFSNAIEIIDACLKAADVTLLNYEANFGTVIIKIEGDVGAVKAAVEAGVETGKKQGIVLFSHVIAQPDIQVEDIITGKKYLGDKYRPVGIRNLPEKKEEITKIEKESKPEIKIEIKTENIDNKNKSKYSEVKNTKEITPVLAKEEEILAEMEEIKEKEKLDAIEAAREAAREAREIKEAESKLRKEKQEAERLKKETEEKARKEKEEAERLKKEAEEKARKEKEEAEKKAKRELNCNYICALCDDLDCPERRE